MVGRGIVQRALAAAAAASLFLVAHRAVACSPPETGWFAFGMLGSVPENGVVTVGYGCYYACETFPDPESLSISSADGRAVSGTAIFTQTRGSDRYIVFKPDAGALTAGETYTPSLPGVSAFDPFTVVPALGWSDTRSFQESIGPVDQAAGDEVCCTGPLDSCGDAPCFNTEFERQAVMTIDFSDAPLAEIGQYAYRLRRPGDSADPPWSVGTLASYTLEIGEITTCYTLELLRFVDDEFLTPGERCVDRPNTVIPGIYTTDPQQIGSIVASCDDAPDGYETERCDALESLCMLDHVHCMRFTEECATGGVGGSGPGGTGAGGSDRGGTGSSGVAGSGANGGAGGDRPGSAGEGNGADDGAGDSGEGRTVITEGCGCTVPGQRGLRGSSFLAFGALAWWARRRKLRSRNASRVSDLAARLESASSP